MIKWKLQKPDANLAQVIVPGSNGVNLPLQDAIKKFMAEANFPAKTSRYSAKSDTDRILNVLDPKKGINTFTVGDVNKMVKVLKQRGVTPDRAESTRSQLAGVIRFCKTGERKTYSAQKIDGAKSTRLKIGEAPIEKLVELIGPASTGRFAGLKSDVKKAVETCPANQFRVIYPTKLMMEKEEEREAARMAIFKMLRDYCPGWVIKWAAGEEVFVVVREEQWRAIAKKGVKK